MPQLPVLLAQVDAQADRALNEAQQATDQAVNWLTEDPTGQIVGVVAVVLIAALALVVLFKTCKWMVARWKTVVGLAVVAVGGYLGVVYLLDLGPTGWAIGGAVAFGLFFGAALFATQGGSR